MYPVGTPIRVHGNVDGIVFRGRKGIIRGVEDFYYNIEFERPNGQFHSCGGRTKAHHGWNVTEQYIRLKEIAVGDRMFTCGFHDNPILNGFMVEVIAVPQDLMGKRWSFIRIKILKDENKHLQDCFLKHMGEAKLGIDHISWVSPGGPPVSYANLLDAHLKEQVPANIEPAPREFKDNDAKFEHWREKFAKCNREGWKDEEARLELKPIYYIYGGELKDKAGTWTNKSMCGMMWMYENGKHVFNGNQACHADLKNLKSGPKERITHFVTYLMGVSKLTEPMNAFVEYLLNDSRYSEAFLTKDPDEAVHSGIKMNTEADGDLVCAAAMATRYVYEHTNRAETWYKLVNAGLGMNEAFTMCHIISSSKNDGLSQQMLCGHCVMYLPDCGKQGMQNYINGVIANPAGESFQTWKIYRSITRLWGRTHYWDGHSEIWRKKSIQDMRQKKEGIFGVNSFWREEDLGKIAVKMMELLELEREAA